jgi:hypothetical protein
VLEADKLPSRLAHRLPEDVIVYCTFNRLGRITPDMLEVLARSIPSWHARCLCRSAMCWSRRGT